MTEPCAFVSCAQPRYYGNGDYCRKHQRRYADFGDPAGGGRLAPPWLRVLTKAEDVGGCWVHTRPSTSGYAHVTVGGGRRQVAHRAVYEALVGPVPEGLDLDHLCRNPACVNPAHLEPVTRSVNLRRGKGPLLKRLRSLDRVACSRGHLLSGSNLYVRPNGRRDCRTCKLDQLRAWRTRRVA